MSDQEREQKKLKFLSSIDQNFKQSEKDVEELQTISINKQGVMKNIILIKFLTILLLVHSLWKIS